MRKYLLYMMVGLSGLFGSLGYPDDSQSNSSIQSPAKSPEQIELYMTAPDQPFIRLELITAQGDNLIKKLKEKAARLGADAIYDFKIKTAPYGTSGNGGDVFSGLPGSETVGTAWAIQWVNRGNRK